MLPEKVMRAIVTVFEAAALTVTETKKYAVPLQGVTTRADSNRATVHQRTSMPEIATYDPD